MRYSLILLMGACLIGCPGAEPGDDDGSTVGGPSVGSVVDLGDCEAPGELSCRQLRVTCPDLPDLGLSLYVSEPEGVEEPRGVVVLGSGGDGTTAYDAATMNDLTALGYRVVNRLWEEGGWPQGDVGMAQSACRYATLLTWLRAQQPAELPLCVTGNSGGSAEISYGLTHWGTGGLLDLAVPTGGPPMARLDLVCADEPEWQEACLDPVPIEVCGGAPTCSYQSAHFDLIDSAFEGTPCTDGGPPELLQDHSVLAAEARLDYPETLTHFIFGGEDCSSAIPQGFLYAEAVVSDKVIEVVDAPHQVFSSPAGRAAIVRALDEGCVCRHPDCAP
ncbi:MAG: hypothetical protein VX498_15005 [Myxococcota bacterium]|nr:hypothetical protein [Myxococcota bacterium]